MGYRFGPERAYEVSLRVQHFSNAGIKKPNPGENFMFLRFSLPW
ncbi:lipid A 3-O-deacylase domain protein [Bordetella bronchiseptica OSU553]|nr:lipid A 3-O-deacylase domain protein [Bordetella bronchiseptica OSU553]